MGKRVGRASPARVLVPAAPPCGLGPQLPARSSTAHGGARRMGPRPLSSVQEDTTAQANTSHRVLHPPPTRTPSHTCCALMTRACKLTALAGERRRRHPGPELHPGPRRQAGLHALGALPHQGLAPLRQRLRQGRVGGGGRAGGRHCRCRQRAGRQRPRRVGGVEGWRARDAVWYDSGCEEGLRRERAEV